MALNDVETKVVYVFPRGRRHIWVAEALRRDIMLGDIEPGAALVELEVGARFQCSQSTVREALMLLQEEGLVQRSGHRGTRVSAWTEDEALEMLHLRRDIERRAAQRIFAGRIRRTSDLVPALRAHVASMEAAAVADDEYALAEADREFHRRLFS